MNIKIDMSEEVGLMMSYLKLRLKSKLETQGHGKRGRSKLIDSMEFKIRKEATIIVGEMYMQDYYRFVDRGVKAANIPYTPGKGRARVSKYIQGLFTFWRRKGLAAKQALSASFATARKHSIEGMPTRRSFRFSKDGTRLGFVRDLDLEDIAEKAIIDKIGGKIEASVVKMFDNVVKK